MAPEGGGAIGVSRGQRCCRWAAGSGKGRRARHEATTAAGKSLQSPPREPAAAQVRGGPQDADATRPVGPPPVPEVKAAPLDAQTATVPLPSAVADVTAGGGGRYLILHLPRERKLAVFDCAAARVVRYLPVADDSIRFAAGAS